MRFKMRTLGDGKSEVTFECESKEEADLIEGALARGSQWVRFSKGGEVSLSPAFEAPPAEPDPLTADFWAPGEVEERFDTGLRDQVPSYFVSGLHAYDGRYEHRAAKLAEAGFECLRSRRHADGLITEHWYLSSRYGAKGPIEGADDAAILRWLTKVGSGNIIESGRTWGLAIDP